MWFFRYENKVITEFSRSFVSFPQTDRALLIMKKVNQLLDQRIYFLPSIPKIKNNNRCGIYSFVLARLLKRQGFPVRILQLLNKEKTVHVMVEVLSEGKWILLDAKENLAFKKPEGSYASYFDIAQKFDCYKEQIPSNHYLVHRDYTVRYTNWEKIPYVLPIVKRVLSFFISDISHFSLRVRFLNPYEIVNYLFLVYFFMVSLYLIQILFFRY